MFDIVLFAPTGILHEVYEEGLKNCMRQSEEINHSWHKIQAGLLISNTTVLTDVWHDPHISFKPLELSNIICMQLKLVIKDTLYGHKFLDIVSSQ